MAGLDAVVGVIVGRFGRAEPRARVGAYLRGLLARLERKNGWALAEHGGAACPEGMRRLLRTAGWNGDGVRGDLRGYVLEHRGVTAGVPEKVAFVTKPAGHRHAGSSTRRRGADRMGDRG